MNLSIIWKFHKWFISYHYLIKNKQYIWNFKPLNTDRYINRDRYQKIQGISIWSWDNFKSLDQRRDHVIYSKNLFINFMNKFNIKLN